MSLSRDMVNYKNSIFNCTYTLTQIFFLFSKCMQFVADAKWNIKQYIGVCIKLSIVMSLNAINIWS